MADSLPDSRTSEGSGGGPGGAPTPRRPRWVKVSLVIALVLALLIGGLLLFGGGRHGPGRHFDGAIPSGGAGGETPAAGVPLDGMPPGVAGGPTPPVGAPAHRGRQP